MDLHRASEVQDKMGEEGYLPSREELRELRSRTLQELAEAIKGVPKNRGDAVRLRRLLTVSILCDNFQRSGAITNATVGEFNGMTDGVIRVSEHKSRASYGSLNLVVKEQLEFLQVYVDTFRPLLVKGTNDDKLFPSARVSEDVSSICSEFKMRPFNPTLMRKSMGSMAYGCLTEPERRKVANHMTHRPETAFRAYTAKNKRGHALETVGVMNQLMYGEGGEEDREGGRKQRRGAESIGPSSTGALVRPRVAFTPSQECVLQREARRLKESRMFVTMSCVLQLMARNKPLFDSRSPKTVEGKLRSMLAESQANERWSVKRRRTRH